MDPIILQNNLLSVTLSRYGEINAIRQLSTGDECRFQENFITITTDFGALSFGPEHFRESVPDGQSVVFKYSCNFCDYSVQFTLNSDRGYFERVIELVPFHPITLYRLENQMILEDPANEVIDYHTFWNCPTVIFFRKNKHGIFTGFANPFFEILNNSRQNTISFEPSLILKAGEFYRSESNFWGMYSLSGDLIYQQIPKSTMRFNDVNHTRYRNPSGYMALDRNEIRSFKRFTDDYLQLRVTDFKLIFYNFFIPLPQLPSTEEEEQIYYRYLDTFAKMGGDIVTFNPLVRHRNPRPVNDSAWEIAPEGSSARRIIDYAKKKGLQYGFYMGTAAQNANYSNSPMNPITSTIETPLWKKRGMGGEIARENCIACDQYAEWFYQVQKNTIQEYGITLWDWDPGPGNGYFCYSPEHGHIPGKGAYKGFRNAMDVVQKLKRDFKNLYIQGFHGTKEYGLWGFRGFDQHESYWEQHPYNKSDMYPDISEDRLTTSGMRFQSWWNQNFRFFPAVMNHSLAHRMTQDCLYPQELRYLSDHLGWKYSLMSALAAGGSATVSMIPYDPDEIYGGDYLVFYQKWIQWAKETFEYTRHTVAFGEQLTCGGIDGYAKIIGDHGFIYLCNASPIKGEITFELGEEIGLTVDKRYTLKQLYPQENVFHFDAKNDTGVFSYSQEVSVTVPQYEVMLFELQAYNGQENMLFNLNGNIQIRERAIIIDGCSGPGQSVADCRILLSPDKEIQELLINGKRIPFNRSGNWIHSAVCFEGEHYPRYLYDWKTETGMDFSCPNRDDFRNVTISTAFFAPTGIQEILDKAIRKATAIEEDIISRMKTQLNRSNFTWAQPHRLFLVFPFVDEEEVGKITLLFNGKEECLIHLSNEHYNSYSRYISFIDITGLVRWGQENTILLLIDDLPKDQFLGAYLYYPPSPDSHAVTLDGHAMPAEPVLTQGIECESRMKPWYEASEKQVRINSAWIAENRIEEFRSFTVYASVNLPYDELEGVYVSAQIHIDKSVPFSLKSDEMLVYDPIRKLWKTELHMGNRQLLIIDGEYLHFWAVAKDKFVSPTYKVKVEWGLF
jgi:hypothetical protein